MALDPITLAALAAAGGSSVLSAGAQFGADRALAKGMVPDEWKAYLEELEASGYGMNPEQRGLLQADQTAMRAGALADAEARQRAVAAAGNMDARGLFMQDLATQQAQAQMMNEQTRTEKTLDVEAEAAKQAMIMELQQRMADQEAAKKAAFWRMLGATAEAGSTAVGGFASADAAAKANTQFLEEQAKNREAMMMASIYSGVPMTAADPSMVVDPTAYGA
jgi:hypothetical protein